MLGSLSWHSFGLSFLSFLRVHRVSHVCNFVRNELSLILMLLSLLEKNDTVDGMNLSHVT